MKLRIRSVRVAALAFVFVASCNVSFSVAASRGLLASGGGGFCSEPSIDVVAVPPPFKVRLGVDRGSVRPGGQLRVRVEDLGTEDVVYGLAYELARWEGGSWVKQRTGPFFKSRSFVRAGTASACQGIDIPSQAAPGLYRVSKKVAPKLKTKSMNLMAEFRVH
ncbi:MAG TPA: immunoglobulin-like domain-containing protein [Solirubrobacterales bacterium]